MHMGPSSIKLTHFLYLIKHTHQSSSSQIKKTQANKHLDNIQFLFIKDIISDMIQNIGAVNKLSITKQGQSQFSISSYIFSSSSEISTISTTISFHDLINMGEIPAFMFVIDEQLETTY